MGEKKICLSLAGHYKDSKMEKKKTFVKNVRFIFCLFFNLCYFFSLSLFLSAKRVLQN